MMSKLWGLGDRDHRQTDGRGICQVQGGRCRGRRYARVKNYYVSTTNHKGLCAVLGTHVFNFSQKVTEDKMRTTCKNIVHHVGTIHGHDISNKLQKKKTVVIPKMKHTKNALDEHELVI